MKMHIIGLAGSGKTTFADWASFHSGVSATDLDWVVYSGEGARPIQELHRRLDDIRSRPSWITEGAYHEPWLRPLLEDAAIGVWLDISLMTCLMRLVKRHALAELRHKNKHPGWRKLLGFVQYTRGTARAQREATAELMRPFGEKVRHCRSSHDVRRLKATLESAYQ